MTNAAAYAHLCPGCFTDKGTASLCPHCGYDESLKRGPLVLPHRTLLHHGQYLIGKVLGKPGGFGITYLALDTKLQTRVAIKEYLPRDLAGRDAGHATISAHSAEDGEFFRYGLTQFLQEARTLAQFDHANIVRVRNFFEENGTGYLVMDYYDGITLADYLAQQPQGKLAEQTAVGIMMPILDGLREVHARNILHRDIKPQNIYLTTANRPILLDFGAARQAMGERSRSLSVVLSEGYAPYEQYHRRGEQGPWTDIYACAAVLYHAVSGEAPPPATERMHKDELDIAALGVSASLAEALRLGLAADHHRRPQKMTEFQGLLLGGNVPSAAIEVEQKPQKAEMPAPATVVASPAQDKGTLIRKWWVPILAVLFAIVMQAMFSKEEKGKVPTTGAASGVPINAVLATAPSDGGSSSSSASTAEKILEDQLTCTSNPEPGKTIRTMLASGLLRETNNGYDGIPVLSPTSDIYVFGKKVKYVKGWEMDRDGTIKKPFWRAPGTPPPYFIAILLDADLRDVHYKEHLIRNADGMIESPFFSTIKKSDEHYDKSGTEITCYGEQPPTFTAPATSASEDAEAARWKSVENSTSKDDYDSYLRQYPKGKYVALAKSRIKMLQSEAVARQAEAQRAEAERQAAEVGRREQEEKEAAAIAKISHLLERSFESAFGGKMTEASKKLNREAEELVSRRNAEAVGWIRKAAEQGNAAAEFSLGSLYFSGTGVTMNKDESLRWFRRAAEQGHVVTQTLLGFIYKDGLAGVKDGAEAVQWLRKAAEQGQSSAQAVLGYMLLVGEGVSKDEAEAIRLFRKSAAQGNALGQMGLGVAYFKGIGVARDIVMAESLLRMAAAQGVVEAQVKLQELGLQW